MPYLDINSKDRIDTQADLLYKDLNSMPPEELAGVLNYLNFKIVKNWITKNGKKYWIFALLIGTLICCILEIYRKLVAPYEEIKEKENGEI